MNIELHVISNGVDQGPIPSYESVNLSPVLCDYGSISFDYPKNGKRSKTLLEGKDEIEIVPYVDGVAYPRFGGLVQEVSGDDVVESGLFSYTGLGYLTLMDEARVYPYNWPTFDPKQPKWTFANATVGTIVRTFVQAAQGRGSLAGVTTAFTNTTDSAGVAWAKTISIEVVPGVTITEVMKTLSSQGMCEFVMNGRELKMYNPDTLSVDRTVQANPVTFRKGRDLRDSPRKTSSRNVATVLLGAGKDDTGLYVEEADTVAVAGRRRIEGYVGGGNIEDEGTLRAYLETTLETVSTAMMEKAHGLEFVKAKSPRPIRDFDVGDWCYSDVGKGLERLRVKQWVLSIASDGQIAGSVVMNDLFAEMEEKLANRLRAIENGSSVIGETQQSGGDDALAPGKPSGLAVSSVAYTDGSGKLAAQATASWLAVTTNADGTVCEDLAGYILRYQTSWTGTSWTQQYIGNTTSFSWSPLPPNSVLKVQVQAIDQSGNPGEWSTEVQIQTGADATPPAAPSTPILSNYLGLLRIRWDGTLVGGAAVPSDFSHVEIHLSNVSNFTPSNATYIGLLTMSGSLFWDVTKGTDQFVKFIAVDTSKNKSTASVQQSGQSWWILGPEIFDGAVGSAKIADLAVTTAKINDLAVNNAKIGSMEVGKLTTGILIAEVTVGGRLATALTGARREMNAVGFQAWDASNNLIISLDGVNNLLTGRYRSAVTGRRIELGSSGKLGEVEFYSASGRRSFIRSFTESAGIEALQVGVDPVDTTVGGFWNKINMNDGGWTTSHANRWDFMFALSGALGGTGFFRIGSIDNPGGTGWKARVDINTTRNAFIHPTDGDQVFYERIADGSLVRRFSVEQDLFYMAWAGTDRRFEFRPSASAASSPGVVMFNGTNNGGMLKYHYSAGSPFEKIQARGFADTYDIEVWCSKVVASSSEAIKEDIADFSGDAMAEFRGARVATFRRKRSGGPKEPAATELGVIAEQMPKYTQVLNEDGSVYGVDTSAVQALIIAALKKLDDRLDKLEKP